MKPDAVVIAVLGAESTGKTTLAQALAERLAAETGLSATWVPEWLRAWCAQEGRTPQPGEQAGIAERQHLHIAQAASAHEIVVCDTTALMTAVYSGLLFGDDSLVPMAVQAHRQVSLSLLTALDLPWVADGHQRDGAHVRAPVDAALRRLLMDHRLPWALVSGTGPARVEGAVDAVSALLRARKTPKAGLFTRLAQQEAARPEWQAWQWACESCDVPECEHALRRAAAKATPLS